MNVLHVVDEPSCRTGFGVFLENSGFVQRWGLLGRFRDTVSLTLVYFACFCSNLRNMGTESGPLQCFLQVSAGIYEIEFELFPWG
jgi:hypothetical protein